MDWERAVTIDDALIDTGAYRSLIPRALAEHLGLVIIGSERDRTPD